MARPGHARQPSVVASVARSSPGERRPAMRTLSVIAAVLLALMLTGGSAAPAAAKPQPRYRIRIQASASWVAAGQTIVLTGRVRPASQARTRQNVKLQVDFNNGVGFETSGLDEPNGRGKYKISEPFLTPGTYVVRVRIAAARGHREGISEELTITVT